MKHLNLNQTFGKFASETPEEREARMELYNINAADNNVRFATFDESSKFQSLKELGRKFNANADATEQARAAMEMFSRALDNYSTSHAPKFKKIAIVVASAYPNFNRG